MQTGTYPRPGLAKRCCVGDGITVPVEETEDVDEESSSRIGEELVGGRWVGSSQIGGGSRGSFASLAFANDFWRSLMGIDLY